MFLEITPTIDAEPPRLQSRMIWEKSPFRDWTFEQHEENIHQRGLQSRFPLPTVYGARTAGDETGAPQLGFKRLGFKSSELLASPFGVPWRILGTPNRIVHDGA